MLASLAPGVTGDGPAQGTQSCMSSNIVMDGVSTMDTGSSGSALFNINTESIAEVKVLESGYQAEYGLRSGLQVHGGHQERDEPVPRLALQRAPQFQLELQQQGQQFRTACPRPFEGAGHRVLDRRPDRETGRPQQAVLLLCRGVQPRDRRRHAADVPAADRAGAAGRFLADHRQPRQSVSRTSRIRSRPARARRPRPAITAGASRTAACWAGFPPTGSIAWA